MVQINRDPKTFKPPFRVILFDAMDAYYYADVMDGMSLVDTLPSLAKAETLARALFVVKNYKWDSLDEMNGCDGGYDVRVFDARFACVYAAHEEFKEKWIGE